MILFRVIPYQMEQRSTLNPFRIFYILYCLFVHMSGEHSQNLSIFLTIISFKSHFRNGEKYIFHFQSCLFTLLHGYTLLSDYSYLYRSEVFNINPSTVGFVLLFQIIIPFFKSFKYD